MDHPAVSWLEAPALVTLPLHNQVYRHINTSGLGSVMSVNTSTILVAQQRRQIQVMATAMSTVSIAAALCAMYWFCLMRRNFRRDLVLLLITGDFWKSFVYLLYAVVNISKGQLQTKSPFCQAGGYMLSVGIEACGKNHAERLVQLRLADTRRLQMSPSCS